MTAVMKKGTTGKIAVLLCLGSIKNVSGVGKKGDGLSALGMGLLLKSRKLRIRGFRYSSKKTHPDSRQNAAGSIPLRRAKSFWRPYGIIWKRVNLIETCRVARERGAAREEMCRATYPRKERGQYPVKDLGALQCSKRISSTKRK